MVKYAPRFEKIAQQPEPLTTEKMSTVFGRNSQALFKEVLDKKFPAGILPRYEISFVEAVEAVE